MKVGIFQDSSPYEMATKRALRQRFIGALSYGKSSGKNLMDGKSFVALCNEAVKATNNALGRRSGRTRGMVETEALPYQQAVGKNECKDGLAGRRHRKSLPVFLGLSAILH
jgi:hypothetical protein